MNYMIDTNFSPNYSVHPGETILDVLNQLNMSQKELSIRISLTEKHISEIIRGVSPVTPETAIKLENVLGISASFWLNLQKNFDELLARNELEKRITGDLGYTDSFPYVAMAKLSWVPKATSKLDRTINLMRFFGVDDLTSIKTLHYVAFRRSNKHKTSPEALAAWLRKGEIEANKIQTEIYDKKKLLEALPGIRALTKKNPNEYMEELHDILTGCGIALVVLHELPKTCIHGAAKWLSPNKALVQLSIRYRFADIFWFSLFHEIGHILQGGKKDSFIDEAGKGEKVPEEIEADSFAQEALIPKESYKSFIEKGTFSVPAIEELANKINVDKGVIVGRLQHEGIIKFSEKNHLRSRYTWAN
jgi:HTH-type transcriptional regulator / antitoxin HigA